MTTYILDREPPPADRRILYGDHPLQFADLRLPEGEGPHPAVIAIHGGFWRNAYSLDHLGHLCAALTARGMATWNIEYRRVGDPGGGWPGSFLDVAAGSRFLFDHAAEYGVDAGRLMALGHSAGGHLAAWLASVANVPPDSPMRTEPLRFQGVVSLAGVLDLRRCHELRLSNDAVVGLLGGTPGEVPDRYAAASPVALVPPACPVLLIHGLADENVPVELSERYQEAALAAGGRSALLRLPRADHFDVIDPESTAWPAIEDAIARVIRDA